MAWHFGSVLVVVFGLVAALCDGLPMTMKLERGFPMGPGVKLSKLVARDRARHGRMLQSNTSGIADFPVDGTFNPYLVGLYYTTVQLGSPPKDFYVQIDTGSDVLWVGCSSCSGCPSTSGLNIPLTAFNPKSSSSASEISCTDGMCVAGMQSSEANCSAQNNVCSYSFQYGDGSTTSGYYLSDTLHFDKVVGSAKANSNATVVFGCSTAVSGQLTNTERAVAGIFGFGQQKLSVISQLASQGKAPNAFSHCLKGDDAGGGILVLGEIIEPSMVYSPLVPSQPHYNLNLESISVNGATVNIDSSAFATSDDGGTIIDSGTTIAYFAEKVYTPLASAIDAAVSQSIPRVPTTSNQCYAVSSSVDNAFPQVALQFEGKASMALSPKNYMLKQGTAGSADLWCFGFMGIEGAMTILGDIVLKDRIIVYDLAGQRIGWTDYDCSKSVNVTNAGETETVNAGGSNASSSSSRTFPEKFIVCIVMAAIIYTTSILSSFNFFL